MKRRLVTTLFAAAAAFSLHAAVLFPKPIHLVRRIDDSISGRSATVDQYCAGNRIVTVRGSRTTIIDYEKQELTEIDHAAGTYSVTRFDEIAKARPAIKATASSQSRWHTTPLGMKSSAGNRSLDSVEIERTDDTMKQKIEVGVDRQVALSKDAVEALIGASYPNTRTEIHDLLLDAAGPQHSGGRATLASADADVYGLPSEQTITFESEGNRVTTHDSIVSVSYDSAPPEALNIDPGAQKVESKLTRAGKELEQIEKLPAPKP